MSGDRWLTWWTLSLRKALCKARHRAPRRALNFLPWLESLEERSTPTVVTLTSTADNTLYQATVATSQLSNGAGQHFYVGDTGPNGVRRGLVKFDLSSIPSGSTIN